MASTPVRIAVDRFEGAANIGSFDARAYWEERLSGDVGVRRVGNRSFGLRYNGWLYRVRRVQFIRRMHRSLGPDRSRLDVLDIGSGSGVYVDLWHRLGVRRVVGSDLTIGAVSHLRRAFPGMTFEQGDVGDPNFMSHDGPFDVVSAFDVLFHIVDDERFAQAIANVARLLKPGGYFVFSDLFLHGRTFESLHQVGRTLDHISRVLRRSGFDIIQRRPIFVIMEAPVDSTSVLHKRFWRTWRRLVSQRESFGWVAGAIAFPVELALSVCVSEGPSIEMMVCRRLPDGPSTER